MTQRRIYQSVKPYLVTSNCFCKYPVFANTRCAEILMKNIFKFCENYKAKLYGYCTMPDHLHITIKPSASFNLSRVIGAIKSKTAFEILEEKLHEGRVWQPRFNDRILNTRKELLTRINYMKANPTRKCLENKYRRLPYMHISYNHWEF
jgi:REP element-mobilizing transposase RayT